MSAPIVFIHRGTGGDLNYLNYAALQARLSNPDTPVVVIGDEAARQSVVISGVKWVPLEGLVDAGIPLRNVYQHYRVNSPEYTLFCMERWFYLREFMRREGCERVMHLDGDVMLYANLEAEFAETFKSCDLTVSLKNSTHTTSISQAAVDTLCELILATYLDSGKLCKIRDRWNARMESDPPWTGIGDMHFMKQVCEESGLRVRETYEGHDPVFDGNIRSGRGFQMEGGIKRIEFRDGQPYGFREEDGRPQRFASLHFQYNAKQFMPGFLQAPPGSAVPGELAARLLAATGSRIQEMGRQRGELDETLHSLESKNEKLRKEIAGLKKHRKTSVGRIKKASVLLQRVADSAWLKAGNNLGMTRSKGILHDAMKNLNEIRAESDECQQEAQGHSATMD